MRGGGGGAERLRISNNNVESEFDVLYLEAR